MSYDYDPELAPLLDLLPDTGLDISDPVASRAGFRDMIALLNADLDASGLVDSADQDIATDLFLAGQIGPSALTVNSGNTEPVANAGTDKTVGQGAQNGCAAFQGIYGARSSGCALS